MPLIIGKRSGLVLPFFRTGLVLQPTITLVGFNVWQDFNNWG